MAGENDSWNDDDNSNDSEKGTISAGDQEILDTVKASGVSVKELTGRAVRDLQREKSDAAAANKNQDQAVDNSSDDKPLSKAETEQIARNAAQVTVATAKNQQRFESQINEIVQADDGLGKNISARKLLRIHDDVGRELGKNINLANLSSEQFNEELIKATKQVIKEEKEDAQRITGSEDTQDMASRLAAQANSTNSGKSGGVSNKASVAEGTDDDLGESSGHLNVDPDNMEFGIDTKWPSEDQANRIRDKELAAHDKRVRAGR